MTATEATTSAPDLRSRFKIAKRITIPQLKIAAGNEYFVKILTKIEQARNIESSGNVRGGTVADKEAKKEPPMVCQVEVLGVITPSGDQEMSGVHQIVCSTIMVKELTEQYPGDAYVGKSFAFSIYKIDKKAYNGVTITEIAGIEAEKEVAAGGKKK